MLSTFAVMTGPITVNLQTGAASLINGGAAGGFSNINFLAGSKSSADTLTGPNTNTSWMISSANGGQAGTFAFTGIENLAGGRGVDVFKFAGSGSVSGRIDSGDAPLHTGNWLDYSALAVPVTVNLQTGSAARAAGGVINIQNVHGGIDANTLTGNRQGNILIGGTGFDTIQGGSGASILIGDGSGDKIIGGSGGNIVIGGFTSYDSMTAANEVALMSILAEWQRTDESYSRRISHIRRTATGGLNGNASFNASTIRDDGAADALTGGEGLDWFWANQAPGGVRDSITDLQPGEQAN
jgi:Ca2+-binding RTX toxin-like protein